MDAVALKRPKYTNSEIRMGSGGNWTVQVFDGEEDEPIIIMSKSLSAIRRILEALKRG